MTGRRLPTRAADWRLVARTVRLVVGIPRYAALAVLAAVASLTAFSVSQNPDLGWFALTGPLALGDRVTILLELYPFLGTVFPPEVGVVLLGVAALVGVDVALLAYHLARRGASARSSGGSLLGVVFGVLGAGCAACGSVVLAGVLSLVGGAGALTALPLDGLEFALVGTVPLVLSVYWIAEGMRGSEVRGCPVEV
ncbi:hypothetical protein BRC81_08605 [Halobacteriales archaeon QS_1_68_20]|nr:MAG: hypothetical protein BRC81_08605 [Halobacteriales archaeon QS_1_68_20]